MFGDLCGSRTRVDGMKTRCTNRYTKRPIPKCTFSIITDLKKSATLIFKNLEV